ncbi:MAG: TerB family tellurite resistance protein, partial [Caulobacterales bacterium]
NADQRLTVLLNLVDMALADGHADANEAAFVHLCQRAFGITDEEFPALADPIMMKNDRRQFGA